MSASGLDSAVQRFVDEHSDAEVLPSGKVRCTITNHEMAAELELLKHHWSGKKYAVRKSQSKYDFKQHEPWIVPHKKDSNLLYCTLTKQPLSRQPKTVEGHVNGKRFRRLLEGRNAGDGAKAEEANGTTEKRSRAKDEDEDEELFDEDAADVQGGSENLGDDLGDAAEFLREGAFWEAGENEAHANDADDNDDEEDDAFWVRGAQDARHAAPEDAKPRPPKRHLAATSAKRAAGGNSRSGTTADSMPSKEEVGKRKGAHGKRVKRHDGSSNEISGPSKGKLPMQRKQAPPTGI